MLSIFSNLDQKSHEVISFLLIACLPAAARGAASEVRRVPPAIITYTTCVGVKGCSIDTHTHTHNATWAWKATTTTSEFFHQCFLNICTVTLKLYKH